MRRGDASVKAIPDSDRSISRLMARRIDSDNVFKSRSPQTLMKLAIEHGLDDGRRQRRKGGGLDEFLSP